MTHRSNRILYLVLLLCGIAAIISLVLYALRQNINLYFTPTELVAESIHKANARVRIGGMVQPGSIKHLDGLLVTFVVTDFKNDIAVQYNGVLPDLFREGQGVVAMGRLGPNHIFIADQILAKHDENYMPPGSKNAA